MCGRYTLSAGESEILERFNVDDVFMETRLTPRFNIAPTQDIAVILSQDGKRVLTAYKWGLIPLGQRSRSSQTNDQCQSRDAAREAIF